MARRRRLDPEEFQLVRENMVHSRATAALQKVIRRKHEQDEVKSQHGPVKVLVHNGVRQLGV